MDILIPNNFIDKQPKYKLFQVLYYINENGINDFLVTGIKAIIEHDTIETYRYYSEKNRQCCSNKKYEESLFESKEVLLEYLKNK